MDEKNNSSFPAKFSSAPLLTETALIAVLVCFRTVLFWDDLCFTDYCRHAYGMPYFDCRASFDAEYCRSFDVAEHFKFFRPEFPFTRHEPVPGFLKELHPAVFYYLDCVLIFALFRLRDISLHTKSLILVAILQPSYDTAFVLGVLALCGPQFSIRLFGLFLLMFFKPEFSAFFAIILLLIMMLRDFQTLILGTFICAILLYCLGIQVAIENGSFVGIMEYPIRLGGYFLFPLSSVAAWDMSATWGENLIRIQNILLSLMLIRFLPISGNVNKVYFVSAVLLSFVVDGWQLRYFLYCLVGYAILKDGSVFEDLMSRGARFFRL